MRALLLTGLIDADVACPVAPPEVDSTGVDEAVETYPQKPA